MIKTGWNIWGIVCLTAATLLWAGTALAVEPAIKCQAKKNKVAGKYAFCRQKAVMIALKKDTEPDYSKCNDKFFEKWAKEETKAEDKAATCPDEPMDPNTLAGFITWQSGMVADALGGGGLPLLSCESAGGVEYGGMCWFIASAGGAVCDTICASAGLSCNLVAIRDFSGSNGTLANCAAVVDLLDPAGVPHASEDRDFEVVCGFLDLDFGTGCGESAGNAFRVKNPVTNCSADGEADPCISTYRRVCACN